MKEINHRMVIVKLFVNYIFLVYTVYKAETGTIIYSWQTCTTVLISGLLKILGKKNDKM